MGKPSKTALGKRKAPPPKPAKKSNSQAESKKTEVGPTGKPKRKPDQPKKVKLRDQKFLPVPKSAWAGQDGVDSEDEFGDDDLGVEEGLDAEFAGSFARGLDKTGLCR